MSLGARESTPADPRPRARSLLPAAPQVHDPKPGPRFDRLALGLPPKPPGRAPVPRPLAVTTTGQPRARSLLPTAPPKHDPERGPRPDTATQGLATGPSPAKGPAFRPLRAEPERGGSAVGGARIYPLRVVSDGMDPTCKISDIGRGTATALALRPEHAGTVEIRQDAKVAVVIWEAGDRVSWPEAQKLMERTMKGGHWPHALSLIHTGLDCLVFLISRRNDSGAELPTIPIQYHLPNYGKGVTYGNLYFHGQTGFGGEVHSRLNAPAYLLIARALVRARLIEERRAAGPAPGRAAVSASATAAAPAERPTSTAT